MPTIRMNPILLSRCHLFSWLRIVTLLALFELGHGDGFDQKEVIIDRHLQSGVFVDESRPCVPFTNVSQERIGNINSDPRCFQNQCPGGCCRIFEWLVCDEENLLRHLQCACNQNTVTQMPTNSPTIFPQNTDSPTASPTKPPTDAPTTSPSSAPTQAPSNRPTEELTPRPTTLAPTVGTTSEPTPQPTRRPTEFPSNSPTVSPVANPTPAPSPAPTFPVTASPTTAKPSQAPTSPDPTTQEPTTEPFFETRETIDDNGNPVRTTACFATPDDIENLVFTNFTYDYQVSISNGAIVDLTSDNLIDSTFTAPVHDAVANEFFDCNFINQDALFIYQSYPHQTIMDTSSGSSSNCPSTECVTVRVTEAIFVYEAPASTRRRHLQESVAAARFLKDMTTFVETGMEDGLFNPTSGDFTATYVGNVQIGFEIGGGINNNNPVNQPTPAPQQQEPTAPVASPVVNVERNPDDSGEDDNNSRVIPIVFGVAGILLVAIGAVLLLQRKPEDDEVEGEGGRFLEVSSHTEDEKSRGIMPVQGQGQLEMDSTTVGAASTAAVGEAMPPNNNDYYGKPILPPKSPQYSTPPRQVGQYRDSDYGNGQMEEDEEGEDPYTSLTPPKRSERPPLFSQDELDTGYASGYDMRPATPSPSKRLYSENDTVKL